MSLYNDYNLSIVARQRHSELLAVAANDRLARIALSGREPWWRRARSRLTTSATAPEVTVSQVCLPSGG